MSLLHLWQPKTFCHRRPSPGTHASHNHYKVNVFSAYRTCMEPTHVYFLKDDIKHQKLRLFPCETLNCGRYLCKNDQYCHFVFKAPPFVMIVLRMCELPMMHCATLWLLLGWICLQY
jgi:hypothetical protein